MKFILDNAIGAPLILYHAVSSYQLLEVMLHKQLFHAKDRAILLLPDFITEKYPQYKNLVRRRFFDAVYLFPYLQIPHDSEVRITERVRRLYRRVVPYELEAFTNIYIAGAHFYFTLYLLGEQRPFTFFEDAAGLLSRWQVLAQGLRRNFPLHSAIAEKHGLFDGSNPLIERIVCLKAAQSIDVSDPHYQDFSVERALAHLPPQKRDAIRHFFLRRKISGRAEGVLLTQQFANLGLMGETEQARLYETLRNTVLRDKKLFIKKHPDDTLAYGRIFPHARVLHKPFPAELLPYVFYHRPKRIYAFSSSGCANLASHFEIVEVGRETLEQA